MEDLKKQIIEAYIKTVNGMFLGHIINLNMLLEACTYVETVKNPIKGDLEYLTISLIQYCNKYQL